MKKVLMIAYAFPPSGDSGVFRTLRFVKYLPHYGWSPVVLTVKNGSFSRYDPSLLNQLPNALSVYRTRSWEPLRFWGRLRGRDKRHKQLRKTQEPTTTKMTNWKKIKRKIFYLINYFIFIPDDKIGWLPFALVEGLHIIKKHKIDAIYSTGGPWTAHLIGYLLKKITRLPWVADFRDPWTCSPTPRYSSEMPKLRRKIEEFLASKVLKYSNLNIVVTPPIKRLFLRKYSLDEERIMVIYNGFDPSDFSNATAEKQDRQDRFVITYVGSLADRKPDYFLRGLKKLIDENKGIAKELEVIFVGETSDNFKLLLNDMHLHKIVKIEDPVSHSKALQFMRNSSVLLFIIEFGEMFMSTKIFEYLAIQKPILALVQKGVAYDLIKSSGCGRTVNPLDIDAIKETIYDFYLLYKRRNLKVHPNLSVIQQFNGKKLTGELAHCLNAITTKR